MVLPQGYEDYECLGHAVSNSANIKPDPSRYCCVKKNILIEGEEQSFSSSFNEKTMTPGDMPPGSSFTANRPGMKVEFFVCRDPFWICPTSKKWSFLRITYPLTNAFLPNYDAYISEGFEILFTGVAMSL